MLITSLEHLKSYLSKTDSADDVLLTRLANAVTAWMEHKTGRHLVAANITETYEGPWDRQTERHTLAPTQYPIISVAELRIAGVDVPLSTIGTDGLRTPGYYTGVWHQVWTTSEYPFHGIVELNYRAGYELTSIPADLEQAVMEMTALKYRERSHVGTSSQSAAGMSVSFLPSVVPQSVQSVIDSYRRWVF